MDKDILLQLVDKFLSGRMHVYEWQLLSDDDKVLFMKLFIGTSKPMPVMGFRTDEIRNY